MKKEILVGDPGCSDVVAAGWGIVFRRAVFEERFDGARRAMYGLKGVEGWIICYFFVVLLLYPKGRNHSGFWATAVKSHATVCMMLKNQVSVVCFGAVDVSKGDEASDEMRMRSRRINRCGLRIADSGLAYGPAFLA